MFIIDKAIEKSNLSANFFLVSLENMGIDEYKKLSYILKDIFEYAIKKDHNIKNILLIIERCNNALNKKDYISLSDILKYELVPVLKEYKSVAKGKYE